MQLKFGEEFDSDEDFAAHPAFIAEFDLEFPAESDDGLGPVAHPRIVVEFDSSLEPVVHFEFV